MQNWQQTLYAQFANSPSLATILEGFNQAIDPSMSIENWQSQVWNVTTAQGWGLDVWGRIVGVSRVLQVSATSFIGWEQSNDGSGSSQPWSQGIWYAGQPTTGNYALTDDAFRLLIMAKAAANITNGSICSLNNILMTLFSSYGQIWVTDNGNMSMTIEYNWTLTPIQASIIERSGVFPRPAGVAISYKQVQQ